MPELELTAGTIDYEDSGGEGPVLVLLGGTDHGRLGVGPGRRAAARHASLRGADAAAGRAPQGDARGGGPHARGLRAHGRGDPRASRPSRCDGGRQRPRCGDRARGRSSRARGAARVSSCEAFENYPPGLPGKNIRLTALVPGGVWWRCRRCGARAAPPADRVRLDVQAPAARRAARPLAAADADGPRRAPRPAQVRQVRAAGARWSRPASACATSIVPALVVWTPEDRVQRPEHGRRLAAILPDSQLVEIEDSYTLIMRDRPEAFAQAISSFVTAANTVGASAA